MASDLEKNMRATTEGFAYSFDGQWKAGATLQYRAPECMHTMLPTSLNLPVRNNDEWAAHFERVAPSISDGKMTIKDYMASPAERRAVCLTSLEATSRFGPYKNEYVWFLRFDETGKKITEIVEFLDSKAAADIMKKSQEAREASGEAKH